MADDGGEKRVPSEDGLDEDLLKDEHLGEGLEEESDDLPRPDPRIEAAEKRVRDLQARADRAEALAKELQRAEMSEAERIKAELEDKAQESAQWEAAYAQLFFTGERDRVAEEVGIPRKLRNFIPISRDVDEMKAQAETLAEELKKISASAKPAEEEAERDNIPFVPSGTPQRAQEEEADVKKLLSEGKFREAIERKLGRKR